MITFKIDNYENMEAKTWWFWYIEKPEIFGVSSYSTKWNCKRGIREFMDKVDADPTEYRIVEEGDKL